MLSFFSAGNLTLRQDLRLFAELFERLHLKDKLE